MIQFTDDYNAQTIFDQVWEAPYEWFSLGTNSDTSLPCFVHEMDDFGNSIDIYTVTVEMIEEAVLKYYMQYVKTARTMVDYLEDLDANDVDCILQLACFKELRYS